MSVFNGGRRELENPFILSICEKMKEELVVVSGYCTTLCVVSI